jgi:hypothetical protein
MRRWRIALILAACFSVPFILRAFREFFSGQTRIFLLGFRYYATGRSRSSADGGLDAQRDSRCTQALLVGLPLRVLAIPNRRSSC